MHLRSLPCTCQLSCALADFQRAALNRQGSRAAAAGGFDAAGRLHMSALLSAAGREGGVEPKPARRSPAQRLGLLLLLLLPLPLPPCVCWKKADDGMLRAIQAVSGSGTAAAATRRRRRRHPPLPPPPPPPACQPHAPSGFYCALNCRGAAAQRCRLLPVRAAGRPPRARRPGHAADGLPARAARRPCGARGLRRLQRPGGLRAQPAGQRSASAVWASRDPGTPGAGRVGAQPPPGLLPLWRQGRHAALQAVPTGACYLCAAGAAALGASVARSYPAVLTLRALKAACHPTAVGRCIPRANAPHRPTQPSVCRRRAARRCGTCPARARRRRATAAWCSPPPCARWPAASTPPGVCSYSLGGEARAADGNRQPASQHGWSQDTAACAAHGPPAAPAPRLQH